MFVNLNLKSASIFVMKTSNVC